jgi:hypothetical protein
MNHQLMDWFERLTGFRESTGKGGYEQTRQRFEIEGSSLRSRVNQRSFGIGQLSRVAMGSLREQALQGPPVPGRSRVRLVLTKPKLGNLESFAHGQFIPFWVMCCPHTLSRCLPKTQTSGQ